MGLRVGGLPSATRPEAQSDCRVGTVVLASLFSPWTTKSPPRTKAEPPAKRRTTQFTEFWVWVIRAAVRALRDDAFELIEQSAEGAIRFETISITSTKLPKVNAQESMTVRARPLNCPASYAGGTRSSARALG